VGWMDGSVDFGAGALTSAGGIDAFVLKLDKDGNPLWGKIFGDALDQEAQSVAVDAAGNIVVTGYFNGSIGFNSGMPPIHTAQALADIFVVKFDANGNFVWS